jgi:hypothetical protein
VHVSEAVDPSVRRLRAAGYGGLLESPRPLSVAAAQAVHCWRFLDGWHPERLPLYLALYPVDDIDGLIDRVQAIRAAVDDARAPPEQD